MVYLPLSVFDHGEGVQEQRFKVNQWPLQVSLRWSIHIWPPQVQRNEQGHFEHLKHHLRVKYSPIYSRLSHLRSRTEGHSAPDGSQQKDVSTAPYLRSQVSSKETVGVVQRPQVNDKHASDHHRLMTLSIFKLGEVGDQRGSNTTTQRHLRRSLAWYWSKDCSQRSCIQLYSPRLKHIQSRHKSLVCIGHELERGQIGQPQILSDGGRHRQRPTRYEVVTKYVPRAGRISNFRRRFGSRRHSDWVPLRDLENVDPRGLHLN